MDRLPITVTNIMLIGFSDMLESLSQYYTEEIEKPALETKEALDTLDDRLRRLTNYHSYLTELYNYAIHYTRNAPKETKSDMMDKRDALEHILKTVDTKIKTTSRMITVREIKTKDNYGQGVGQARNASNSANKYSGGWGNG
jgi:Na+/phosphate symporter